MAWTESLVVCLMLSSGVHGPIIFCLPPAVQHPLPAACRPLPAAHFPTPISVGDLSCNSVCFKMVQTSFDQDIVCFSKVLVLRMP